MVLNGFNSDDYIYLEILRDFEGFKTGEIVRYRLSDLKDDSFHLALSCYVFNIEKVPKESSKVEKYAFMPFQLYDKIVVKYQALAYHLQINANDLVLVDETFQKLIFSNRIMGMLGQSVAEMNQSQIFSLKQSEVLIEGSLEEKSSTQEGESILSSGAIATREKFLDKYHILAVLNPQISLSLAIDIDEGYEFDLNNPAVALLFCKQFYLRLFANSRMLSEKEKIKYFEKEFAHCQTDDDYNHTDIRYFVLNKDVKIREVSDFANPENYPAGTNAKYFFDCVAGGMIGYNKLDGYDYDNDGFIRYVWVKDCRSVEENLLKIARRATIEETIDHFNHYNEQERLEREAYEYYTKHKREFKRMRKEYPDLTKLEFMLIQKQRLVKKLVLILNKRKNKDGEM